MIIFDSTKFTLPLPDGHRFPMEKYTMLRERVVDDFGTGILQEAPRATDAELYIAHHHLYVTHCIQGTLNAKDQRRIGFPWSPQLIERSRRSAGATLAAARAALTGDLGVNLAGGTHHAQSALGGGYCVFNDSAITLRVLRQEGLITRGLVIDLDVHQGDGTAQILSKDKDLFTFSMHGAKNYPFKKMSSDWDIPLEDQTEDDQYLSLLDNALQSIIPKVKPDLIIYLAGADPYEGDQLGRLSLTIEGLAARDAMVFEVARLFDIPIALTMGGGYAPNSEIIANIHHNTIRIGAQLPPIL